MYTMDIPLEQGSLSPEGRDLMETAWLGLSVPKLLTLYIMSGYESLCICSHLLQKEASLMMTEQGTDL